MPRPGQEAAARHCPVRGRQHDRHHPAPVFEQRSSQLGHAIVVENRSGAGGTIGAGFVAKADPDGYTLLANSNAHTIAPSLYPNLSYDPARDFAAVIPLGTLAGVLVVSPEKGFKTARDLWPAQSQARSDRLLVGRRRHRTHLGAERFRISAGINVLHIQFRGGAEAMTEVMAGR